MATATVPPAHVAIQVNSKILVTVEKALADLIVVSFTVNNQKFQGVLLDSSKRCIPFGVYNLNPALSTNSTADKNDDNRLHSVAQRFAYQDQEVPMSANVNKMVGKGNKMTVRLRPRTVLCSNCRAICNDSSDNVDVSNKRKLDAHHEHADSQARVEKKYLMGSKLVPKLSRLQPSEISNAIKGSKGSNNSGKSCTDPPDHKEMAFVSVPNDCDSRKRKDDASYSALLQSAKTLKICFGDGEGTVVKIPPFSGNGDSGVTGDTSKPDAQSKAAKKAKKRSKKRPKRNDTSTKRLVTLSPRNTVDNSSAITDPKDKKHKRAKDKKRSKILKKCDENLYFKKKKKGVYKTAVKLALLEAQQDEAVLLDPLASPTQTCNVSPRL